jgi:hypothetical protein
MFWALTAVEFNALREVHDAPVRRWAMTQATLHNAHFVTEGVPWMAEDFMGGGNRSQRVMRQQRDNIDMAREQMRLARIVPGAPPPADTPSWAIGEYHCG